ncbi:MAG: NADH-quinone oxidoreductase subunit L, partial [Candidatus Omnitrophica bacterium]|nr:NADH-quinone oxidoreductase subunit L [Candidatus Omnitrophota bacterium]
MINDGLSVFFAVISSLVGVVIIFYSIEYMKRYKNLAEYYFLVLLFIGSMMGLVFSANLLLIYVFWEIAAICSWRLIGFYRGEKDLRAANKAFLITFSAASVMLLGFIMIYLDAGTFNLNELKGTAISNLAFLFIFVGIMAKSCLFPLH